MKAAIIYYSFSGNTKRIAGTLKEKLGLRFEVEVISLEVVNEEKRFLFQCREAFFRKRVPLKNNLFDASAYQLICLGSPVWAMQPAPAIRSFLEKSKGFFGKDIVLFFTYGSGLGVDNCLKETVKLMEERNCRVLKSFTYPQAKIKDNAEIQKQIEELIKNLKL